MRDNEEASKNKENKYIYLKDKVAVTNDYDKYTFD